MTDLDYPPRPVLLVDDEPAALAGLTLLLESDGILNLRECSDSRKLMPLLEQTACSAVVLDLSMPHIGGQELLPQLRERHPELPVIVVTGHNELELAVQCMKLGASDYMIKPVPAARLTSAVRRAVELYELRTEYSAFKSRVLGGTLDHPEAFSELVTQNSRMHSLFQYMETIAVTSRSVFITGETGTGKELVARAIHRLSARRGEFVPVNVAGLEDNVFSDTLFGHLRGAFTGADKARPGLIQKAAGGTLFLDEIGELETTSQVKLLRLLQENEYYPLGADGARLSEARIVVATNRSAQELLESSSFRSDLYYRLQTHHLRIPPLRERKDDLSLLVSHFVGKAAESLGKQPPAVPQALASLLARYTFPGNVRELEAMVFEAVSRHRTGSLPLTPFREGVGQPAAPRSSGGASEEPELDAGRADLSVLEDGPPVSFGSRLPTLTEVNELLICEALRRADNNQTTAAGMLGITRSGLSKALKRKKISPR